MCLHVIYLNPLLIQPFFACPHWFWVIEGLLYLYCKDIWIAGTDYYMYFYLIVLHVSFLIVILQ